MSISLFDELAKGGYEACLMSTYSVDFPFYEDVLLNKMQSLGITHHMLLADKRMCQSIITQRPPNKAGKQYSLALMNCSGAFHPKVIMLLGKNKGLLAVGSHNVTFSGFGKNLELTNIIKFKKKDDEQYLPLFNTAFSAFRTWLNDYALEPNSKVQTALSTALEDTLKLSPWFNGCGSDTTEDAALLFSSATTPSLWQQLTPFIPNKSQQVIAISPFFDKSLVFSKTLREKSQTNLVVGLQPKEAVVSTEILSTEGIKVIDSDTINNSEGGKYIHAKAIYFADEYSPVFVNGSANLSAKAWLDQGRSANAEAVLVRSGSSAAEAAKLVGIIGLADGEEVKELLPRTRTEQEKTIQAASIELISIDEQDSIDIEIKQHWQKPLSVFYIDEWQQKYPIDFTITQGHIVIERQSLATYGVISVFANQQLCSSVIIHYVSDIKRSCTTGAERKAQQAWGSLNTEHPDIKLLFTCLENLSCFNNKPTDSAKTITALSSAVTSNEQGGIRELVVNLGSKFNKNPFTGKVRASQGDIANVLDLVIYSINNNIKSNTQKQYDEDSLGRNEEDLIGSDDEELETKEDNTKSEILKLQLAFSNHLLAFESLIKLASSKKVKLEINKAFMKDILLRDMDLSGWKFIDCDIRNGDFRGSTCKSTEFIRTNLNYSNFKSVNISEAKFQVCAIREGRFINSLIEGADFFECDLRHSKFIEAYGDKPKFIESNLDSADLSDVNLRFVDFGKCSMKGSNLLGSNLFEPDFSHANAQGCKTNDSSLERIISNANQI
jgi:uncharacterized protein YjbI with pentapeptide repeats